MVQYGTVPISRVRSRAIRVEVSWGAPERRNQAPNNSMPLTLSMQVVPGPLSTWEPSVAVPVPLYYHCRPPVFCSSKPVHHVSTCPWCFSSPFVPCLTIATYIRNSPLFACFYLRILLFSAYHGQLHLDSVALFRNIRTKNMMYLPNTHVLEVPRYVSGSTAQGLASPNLSQKTALGLGAQRM